MIFDEKDIKKLTTIVLIIILLILTFFIVRPILVASIGGLILAYIFSPFYTRLVKLVKNKTLAASIVSLVIVAVLAAVLWFLTPILMRQVFDIYRTIQTLDIYNILRIVFPNAPEDFIKEISANITNSVGAASTSILQSLRDLLLELPRFGLNLFVMGFVFFFAMRDSEQLKNFFKGLSPFSEARESLLVKHFKDMTDSVIYGQVIVGIVQGSLAGLALLIFGASESVLFLTLLAIFFSIIPFIGPMVVWVPVFVHMFITQGPTPMVIGYLAFNLIIVSTADNLLRSYLIARRTAISQAIIMMGMIGGLFIFGLLGLVIGPLVMAYLVTLLDSMRDKSIYSIFNKNNPQEKKESMDDK